LDWENIEPGGLKGGGPRADHGSVLPGGEFGFGLGRSWWGVGGRGENRGREGGNVLKGRGGRRKGYKRALTIQYRGGRG